MCKPDHIEQVALGKSPAEFLLQLCTQCVHNLFTIPGSISLEDLSVDPLSDTPKLHGQGGVDRCGERRTCLFNQTADIRFRSEFKLLICREPSFYDTLTVTIMWFAG